MDEAGNIYVGGAFGAANFFYKLDAGLAPKWPQPFALGADGTLSSAISSDGTVLVGTWNGDVIRLDPVTGVEEVPGAGRFSPGHPVRGFAIDVDGSVYVSSGEAGTGHLHKLTPDGEPVVGTNWPLAVNDVVWPAALDTDGTVYTSSANGTVYALDADGALLWSEDPSGAGLPLGALTVGQDRLYVATDADGGGALYAIDKATGQVADQEPIPKGAFETR